MALFGDDWAERRRDLVVTTQPTRAGAVSPRAAGGPDLVAVEGVVRRHDDTVALPLSDASVTDVSTDGGASEGETAASDAGTDEETTTGPAETFDTAAAGGEERLGSPVVATHTRWSRTGPRDAETTVAAVPFVVEDASGSVLVDPGSGGADDRSVLLSAGNTERFLGDETGTRLVTTAGGDETERLARARTALGTTPEHVHERATLREGDRVFVLGEPRRATTDDAADGDSPAVAVGPAADSGLFVVSDLSRSALAEELDRASGGLDRRFWLFVVVGLIAAVMLLIVLAVFVDSFVG